MVVGKLDIFVGDLMLVGKLDMLVGEFHMLVGPLAKRKGEDKDEKEWFLSLPRALLAGEGWGGVWCEGCTPPVKLIHLVNRDVRR